MSSNPTHKTDSKLEPHHGSVSSYVTGFVLSLICTFVPYYMVTRETFGHDARLTIILVFAVLQMMIQVFFFLHLGREKKPHWNALFLVSTIGIILVVVGGSLWIMNNLHYNMAGMQVTDKIAAEESLYIVNDKQAGTCPKNAKEDHEIMLMDNVATPTRVTAHLCDTITFMNHDSTTREITFGTIEKPAMYAGENSMPAHSHHNSILRLTETGTFTFYGKDSKITGEFTVVD